MAPATQTPARARPRRSARPLAALAALALAALTAGAPALAAAGPPALARRSAAPAAATPARQASRPAADAPVPAGIPEARSAGSVERGAGSAPPQTPITRAAFAAMLARVGHVPAGTVGPRFADVPPSSPYHAAVEAVSGLEWMPGISARRFAPRAPADRLVAAVAAANYLGLRYVAAAEAGENLPFADAGTIPASARGDVAVASHLGLLPFAHGRFLPQAPLSRAQADLFFLRLERVRPAQVRAEGDRVAATVHVFPSVSAAAPGASLRVTAYAHDAAGYVVPARLAWSAHGARLLRTESGNDDGTALLRVGGPGPVTITAAVAGTPAAGSVSITSERAASLDAGIIPPAVLSSAALPLAVRILTASGALDLAADGTRLVASATPTDSRGAGTSVSAPAQQGSARLRLPPLAPGRYSLSIRAPGSGLRPVRAALDVVPKPLGSLLLLARGGGASVPAGAALTVDGQVYGLAAGFAHARWPLAVSVSGQQDLLPQLVGESPPPATLTLQTTSAEMPSGGGPVAVLAGADPGPGAVAVSVPGGALAGAALPLEVTPVGAFGPAASAKTVVGHPARLSIRLVDPAGAGPVYLEPIDPAGHPLNYVAAAVAGHVATAEFTPLAAGTWTFRWHASGYLPLAAGTLQALPGAPVQLVVDPTPTSVLLPGQRIALQAWLADRYGNPVPVPFTLTGGAAGTAAAGASGTTSAVEEAGGAIPAAGGTTTGAGPSGSAGAAGPGSSGSATTGATRASSRATARSAAAAGPSGSGTVAEPAGSTSAAAAPATGAEPSGSASAAEPAGGGPASVGGAAPPATTAGTAGAAALGPPPAPVPGQAGWLAFTPGQFGGPGVVGSFTARAAPLPGGPVAETLTFRSPDHPRIAAARVTLRVVASPVGRIAGKGLWLVFPDWRYHSDTQILGWAARDHATHIYLEVATTLDGFYGGRALDNLLVRAHAAGIAVIAWVYAGLEDPDSDIRQVQEVARYVTPSGDRPDGIALDVEEVLTPSTVARYSAAARAAEGAHGLVVGVTYPPQYRMDYPFRAMAPYVQAFAPMDYWHVFESYDTYDFVFNWVRDSVALVRRLSGRPGVPVEVIEQTFDEFSGSGQGIFSPLPHEISAAGRAALDAGAIGVSYYRPTTATPGETAAMAAQGWPPR